MVVFLLLFLIPAMVAGAGGSAVVAIIQLTRTQLKTAKEPWPYAGLGSGENREETAPTVSGCKVKVAGVRSLMLLYSSTGVYRAT